MPSGATLLVIYPQDTPNTGRYKINYNFSILAFSSFTGISASKFTNPNPTTRTVGGIQSGSTFAGDYYLQDMMDLLLYPATTPNFTSFLITSQATSLEVGEAVAGIKTFTWNIANWADLQPNSIDIEDTTNSTIIATNLADDGTETVFLSSVSRTTPGANIWTISAQDTDLVTFSREYQINWYYASFYGISVSTTLNAAGIVALTGTSLVSDIDGSYPLAGSGYGYICVPDAFSTPNGFRDSITNLPVEMAGTSEGYNYFDGAFYYDSVSVTRNAIPITYRVYRTRNTITSSTIAVSLTGGTVATLQSVINAGNIANGSAAILGNFSATTFFSGSSELSSLFGPSTFVAPGVNAYTGGTPSRPIVGVIGSPVFTAVTASSISGTSISATTLFSGNTNIGSLFGPSTFVAPGVNAYTGGTATRPIVGVIGSPVFTAVTASSISGVSISATTLFSGSTDLSELIGSSTLVQPGTNISTGGTPSRPIVGVIGSPVFTAVTASSISGTSISATTFFSGSTDLGQILVAPDLNTVLNVGNTGQTSIILQGDGDAFDLVRKVIFRDIGTIYAGTPDAYIGFDYNLLAGPSLLFHTPFAEYHISRNAVSDISGYPFSVSEHYYFGTQQGDITRPVLIGWMSANTGNDRVMSFIKLGDKDIIANTGGTIALIASGVSGDFIVNLPSRAGTLALESDIFDNLNYVQPGVNISTGGTPSRPVVNVVGSPIFTAVTASSVSGTSVSATTLFSGSTDLGSLIGAPTFVAPGVNAYTGGTPSRPIVGVVGSPVFTAVTASSVSGTSVSATTFFSGSTDLGSLIGSSTLVQPGVNIVTGGTPSRPVVNVVGSPVFTAVTASSVSGTSVSATTFFSGSSDLSSLIGAPTYVAPGVNAYTGGTPSRPIVGVIGSPVFTAVTASSVSGTNISATTIFSGSSDLSGLFGPSTFVAPGANAYTGGTATRPIVGVIGSPVFTAVTAASISGTSISGASFYSGSTSFNDILSSISVDVSRTYRTSVRQASHGLSIGSLVYIRTNGEYTVANSNSLEESKVVGMVTDVIDADSFELTTEGYCDLSLLTTILPVLSPGVTYYLTKTPGVLNPSPPTDGGLIKPVFVGIDASAFYLWNGTAEMSRTGFEISTGNTSSIRTLLGLATNSDVTFNSLSATSSVIAASISATTFFSGSTNLNSLFGPSTFVAPGVNAYTGGTATRPIVGVVGSPVFTAVTASSVSGTSVSATTFFSGASDLSGLFGPSTFVAPGVNAYTGGTSSRPIVGVVGSPVFTAVTASSVSGTSVSATTIFSGTSDLSGLFGPSTYVAPGVNAYTGGTPSRPIVGVVGSPVFTAVTASSVSGTSVSATTFYSGSTDLSAFFGQGTGTPTYVKPGVNISTGGTPSAPVINVVGSPVFTAVTASSVSGTSVSATTFYSGSTNLGSLLGGSVTYVQPGLNITTGGTPTAPIIGTLGTVVFTGITFSTSLIDQTGNASTGVYFKASGTGLLTTSNRFTYDTANGLVRLTLGSESGVYTTGGFTADTFVQAANFISGSTNLNSLFGPSTFITPGVNAYTGGTSSRPIVGVIGSPIFTAVTASSVSGTSISGATLFSGSSNLGTLFAPTTHTHTASQISDSSDAGKDLLTASTVANQLGFLGITKLALSSNYSNSGTGAENVTGLAFSVTAGRTYLVAMAGTWRGNNATNNPAFGFTFSTGTGTISFMGQRVSTTGPTYNQMGASSANTASAGGAGTITANADMSFQFQASISATTTGVVSFFIRVPANTTTIKTPTSMVIYEAG